MWWLGRRKQRGVQIIKTAGLPEGYVPPFASLYQVTIHAPNFVGSLTELKEGINHDRK